MCIHTIAVCLLALVSIVSAQELGLRDYLTFVKTAPGISVGEKIEFLSNIGITLSPQGLRDLNAAVGKPRAYTPPQVYAAPKAKAWADMGEADWNASSRVNPYTKPSYKHRSYSTYTFRSDEDPTYGSASSFGDTTYYNFNDGVTGTSQRFGNQTFHNFSNGSSGTTMDFRNQSYTNWNNGLTGTTQRFGNQTYSNYNNGVTANSQTFGNQTYTRFSNGKNCTTQRFGSQAYTNCR